MKNLIKQTSFLAVALTVALVCVGVALAAGSSWFQGFETDTTGWFGTITRVASGTHLIDSAAGSYHAEAAVDALTRWGGYGGITDCSGTACAAQFPQNGYVTSVDIYLAAPTGTNNDTRFDFSSAINQPDGNFRRDFVFNAGYYNDSDTTGTGPRFVISASNNAGRANSFPKNPGREPFTIADEGWYTFQHTFTDNGAGVLTVALSIRDAAGTILKTWTLSDPTDIIDTNVGSNRYGWFVQQELPVLAIDNSSRSDILSTPADKEQCKKDGWRQLVNTSGATFNNQGQCVKFVTTGK